MPYGANAANGPPFVLSEGKWTPLHRVHSIAILWEHFKQLVCENEAVLKARCDTDWSSYPRELDEAIAAIEKADASSTYFRYPDSRDPSSDAAKSSWKQKDASDIFAEMAPGGKYVKAFFLLTPEGDVSRAFQYDDEPLSDLSKMLRETVHNLAGATFGLRMELANGF